MSLFRMSKANNEERKLIQDMVLEFNNDNLCKKEDDKFQCVSYIIKDRLGKMVAGIDASLIKNNILSIEELWVDEKLRNRDLGTTLLNKVESIAKSQNCKIAYVEMFHFQGKEFYEKNGYEVFESLENENIEYYTYFLKKKLN